MYRKDDVETLLDDIGTVYTGPGDETLIAYIHEDSLHGLIRVEDLWRGRPPEPGHDVYKVQYKGVDAAMDGEAFTDHALLAGSVHELEQTVDEALDRIRNHCPDRYGARV